MFTQRFGAGFMTNVFKVGNLSPMGLAYSIISEEITTMCILFIR